MNLSEKEIEETTSTGVVLVQNQSYYEVVLSNGKSLYFSGFDEDGDLTWIIKEKKEEYAQYYKGLDDIRASDSEIKYHNAVSIAYNNTFVMNTNDFVSCVMTKCDKKVIKKTIWQ